MGRADLLMAKIEIPFVQRFKDRHGKVRHYFRKPGCKRVALPGQPGSQEFMEAYGVAEKVARTAGEARTMPGSISAVIAAYYESGAWKALQPQTQRTSRLILDRFRAEYGAAPAARFEVEHLRRILDKKSDTPWAAKNLLKRLRGVFKFAVGRKLVRHDPTLAELAQDAQTKQQSPPALRVPPTAIRAPAPASPTKAPSFLDQAKGLATSVINYAQTTTPRQAEKDFAHGYVGAVYGVARAPLQFVGGALDTFTDAGVFLGDSIEPTLLRSGVSKADARLGLPAARGASRADAISRRSTLGQRGNPAVNQFTTEAGASSIPLAIPGGGGLSILKAGAGAAVGMTAKDGKERAKNFVIGAAADGAVQLVGMGAKGIHPVRTATTLGL